MQNGALEQTALELSERVKQGEAAEQQLASLRREHDELQQAQHAAETQRSQQESQAGTQLQSLREQLQQQQEATRAEARQHQATAAALQQQVLT